MHPLAEVAADPTSPDRAFQMVAPTSIVERNTVVLDLNRGAAQIECETSLNRPRCHHLSKSQVLWQVAAQNSLPDTSRNDAAPTMAGKPLADQKDAAASHLRLPDLGRRPVVEGMDGA
jgi:hypothetical protein